MSVIFHNKFYELCFQIIWFCDLTVFGPFLSKFSHLIIYSCFWSLNCASHCATYNLQRGPIKFPRNNSAVGNSRRKLHLRIRRSRPHRILIRSWNELQTIFWSPKYLFNFFTARNGLYIFVVDWSCNNSGWHYQPLVADYCILALSSTWPVIK